VTERLRSRVAALDSSPLLLWLAGRADPLIIPRFKHLAMFQIDDYELLDRLLLSFESIVTTPHVLTEVSNHAHHLKGSLGESLLNSFSQCSLTTPEIFGSACDSARGEEYLRFGITDCALTALSNDITVITTDFRLSGLLGSQGERVLNFNQYRQARLFGE